MIFVIAFVLGLATCAQSLLSEVTTGNITHLKNGRPPNAGAALFPLIPIVPLLFLGATWVLQSFVPEYAMWILGGAFLTISLFWAISFARLRGELRRTEAACRTEDHAAESGSRED
jgi:hypothetical protein